MSEEDQTWEMIVEAERPISVSNLETRVSQGRGLEIPLRRSDLINQINIYWNVFTSEMALKKKEEIRAALQAGDNKAYTRAIQHITGISSMYRFNSARLIDSRLILDLGTTDFKEYIGTTQRSLSDSVFRLSLMSAGKEDHENPNYYFANPLATCAVLVSSDGYVPIGFRGNNVAIYPNTHHVIGGYVRINEDKIIDFFERDIDLFANMKTEIKGEVGLSDPDFASINFLGIARNVITRGPEALYVVKLSLTANEVQTKWRENAIDKYEHRNLTFYRAEDVPAFLKQNQGKMVPSGEAALTLYARHYL